MNEIRKSFDEQLITDMGFERRVITLFVRRWRQHLAKGISPSAKSQVLRSH